MTEPTDSKEPGFKRREVMKFGAGATGALVIGSQSVFARGNSHDKAIGEVVYKQADGSDAYVSFNAHSGDHPNGSRGHVDVKDFSGVDFEGTINCYKRVNLIAAQFSGEITQGGDEESRFLIIVLDRATPGHKGPKPDLIRVKTGGSALRDCTGRNLVPSLDDTSNDVIEGNLMVHHSQ